jgi:hypothetical protein
MRESWTDGRLDDLSHRVDEGFRRVDADIRDLRTEMNSRFDALQRTMLQIGGGMIAALLAGFMGLIATQL